MLFLPGLRVPRLAEQYQLPRVAADVVYLWPEVREVEVRPYPYYDPFWGPRWGYWGWW